ncbi:50S ribosomal protein L13 [uncultured Sunxiuqinia sp.]|uniref:50S ribosomal protein L13 n=1 Tax=uncultured Sunxiuqinia sp. TaxID=1573825 RepID=UPI002AA95469|nr:50S ribosomal protein L13 [uncultured Sunxiuqinia sp.]
MDTLSYKTVSANSATANKEWVVVDAADMIVGRLASAVAKILRGKHKPNFTPHADCGDNVIVINAEKVRFSGKKMTDKIYLRHTGYPGGQRSQNPTDVFAKYPERIVESAVRGMLPKNRLGRKVFGNMKVYAGAEHKQEAQNPKVIDLKKIKL